MPAVVGRVTIALDVAHDRAESSIVLAGTVAGRTVVELVDHRPDTQWIAARAEQLWRQWRPAAIYLDAIGPAQTVAQTLEDRAVPIVRADAAMVTTAAAGLYDDLRDDKFRHRAQPALDAAADGGVRRTMLDRWAFSRKHSAGNVSPLIAASLARYALVTTPARSTTIRTA